MGLPSPPSPGPFHFSFFSGFSSVVLGCFYDQKRKRKQTQYNKTNTPKTKKKTKKLKNGGILKIFLQHPHGELGPPQDADLEISQGPCLTTVSPDLGFPFQRLRRGAIQDSSEGERVATEGQARPGEMASQERGLGTLTLDSEAP